MMWRWEDRTITGAALVIGTLASAWIGLAPNRILGPNDRVTQPTHVRSVTPSEPDLTLPAFAEPDPGPHLVQPPRPRPESSLSAPPLFAAHSMDSGFSVRGSYVGSIGFDGPDLVLDLGRAVVQSIGTGEGARLVGIRLSLARGSGRTWTVAQRGRTHPVDLDVSGPTLFTIQDLRLVLPDLPWDGLADGWLVIEHELATALPDGTIHRSWTYVHTERDFGLRFLATLDGC